MLQGVVKKQTNKQKKSGCLPTGEWGMCQEGSELGSLLATPILKAHWPPGHGEMQASFSAAQDSLTSLSCPETSGSPVIPQTVSGPRGAAPPPPAPRLWPYPPSLHLTPPRLLPLLLRGGRPASVHRCVHASSPQTACSPPRAPSCKHTDALTAVSAQVSLSQR